MLTVPAIVGSALWACAYARSDDVGNDTPEYVAWRLPVAAPRSASQEASSIADDLKAVLGQRIDIGRPEANPLCCLWIEAGEGGVWPYPEGYIVVIGRGGGRIIASDNVALKRAVQRLSQLARRDGDVVTLPLGIITDYPANRLLTAPDDHRR